MPVHACAWAMMGSEPSLQEHGIPRRWGRNRFPSPSDRTINLLFFGTSSCDYEQPKQYVTACDASAGKKNASNQPPPLTAPAEHNGSRVADRNAPCPFFGNAGNAPLGGGQLGEVQLSSRNLTSSSQFGSLQLFPALPWTVLAFRLPNQSKREQTRRVVPGG